MQTVEYFQQHKDLVKQIIDNVETPMFVTDKSILQQRVQNIKQAFSNNCLLYYAIKANFNPSIVKSLQDAGIDGIETISPYEIQLAKKLGFGNNQILFTGNNTDTYELDKAKEEGIIINLGSISELRYFANKYKGSEIFIRINPGFGDGEFKKVVTGGVDSKFGILYTQVDEALKIIDNNNIKLIGLHCHLGSGLYSTDKFILMVKYIFSLVNGINSLRFINLGGGFGVRYKQNDKEVDLKLFAEVVKSCCGKFNILKSNDIKIIFEPGKYLVAESTFLLTKITNIREQYNTKIISVDTGFNHIIRPAFYDSYHHIINLFKPNKKKEKIKVVGNICESTDILNEKIKLASPEKGDILAILTVGAYCSSMSSLYNLRPYASEVLIDKDKFSIIRKRMNFEETFDSLGFI